jgi:hypothetical protein
VADSTRQPVDQYPDLTEKETRRVSPTVVLRKRKPTNEFTTSKHPSMVWDYSIQREVWPNGKPDALIEASQHTGHKYDTIDKSGHPFALGNIDMGGAPDAVGERLFMRSPPKKMLK